VAEIVNGRGISDQEPLCDSPTDERRNLTGLSKHANQPVSKPGVRSLLLLESSAAAMPVLLGSDLVRGDTETAKLRDLAQAALQLGETGKARQSNHVVPQPHRVVLTRQSADNRTEKSNPGWRLEVNDGSADVLTGEAERLVCLGADLWVEGRIIQRVGQFGRQAGLGQDRFDESTGAVVVTPGQVPLRVRGGVEDVLTKGGLEQGYRLTTVLLARFGGHPQQPQTGRVAGLVLRREVSVVVDVGVDHPQRNESPLDRVVPLLHDTTDPLAGQPRKRAHRVEVKS